MDTQSQNVSKNIFQRILDVMAEVSYIQKGDARVNGQYRFVSHDQVIAKLHPYLVKHRIMVIPSIHKIEQNGNRTEVTLKVDFINPDDIHNGFTVTFAGYGIGNDDKGPGKAISYALKYALLKVFCLETGDDPDNDADVKFEAAKCQEWDIAIIQSGFDPKLVNKFVKVCADTTGKHLEDIKREALTRMDSFCKTFQNWAINQKSKKEKE